MTSSDVIQYVKDIAPDLSATDNKLLNFLDAAVRRMAKKILWPDCWMTTQTVPGQQEYQSLPVLQVNAVYVGGQLCTPTDRATLEGRQIGLYSQVASPTATFQLPGAAFSGFAQLGGVPTVGDILTTVVGGVSVPYTVLYTDTDLQILAQSIVTLLQANVALQSLAQFSVVEASPVQVYIAQLPNTGAPLTLTVSTNVGATETYTPSGVALTGASNGSGGAPGTVGPFAPSWVISQEPLTYPVQNTWQGSIRPDAAPWGCSTNQPPRYYWRGGKVAIVPNTSSAGITIALDCVRSPDQVTTLGQLLTAPIDWREALAADVLRQAYMGDADSKHIALAQMWETSYLSYEKEILLWRGTFEDKAAGTYRMQTQRFRMGLGNRLRKRCR